MKVYVVGASNVWGSGIRIVLESPKGLRLEKSLRLGFKASNNKVKYEALIVGLEAACKLRVEEVEVFSDSRLVVYQVEGNFGARDQYLVTDHMETKIFLEG